MAILLTRRDVARLLSVDACIECVERGLAMQARGGAVGPAVLGVQASAGTFHVKAAGLALGSAYFAAKVNANFPTNPARENLPTIQGVLVLFDASNGRPLAVMDSMELTALRTGAATAVAAKYLARSDAATAALCGCGRQGAVLLRAVSRVRRLNRVFAYDLDRERAAALARDLGSDLEMEITPVASLQEAAGSDIWMTCTTARSAFLERDHVAPGAFVAAVGADNPEKQEINPHLLAAARIVTDSTDQCAHGGDLHHALSAGLVTREDVYAELGPIVAGMVPGRANHTQIVIFDSTGTAVQDVAAAAAVYENALAQRAGREIDLAEV
jgi:ornithine cyclodeaminase/alanine dehydrogenase-like protein (mu-crystallin family)